MDSIEFRERRDHQKAMEAGGRVADSMEVRLALMQRVHDGEISLEEAQRQLAVIKRTAKVSGKITRNQAFQGRSA